MPFDWLWSLWSLKNCHSTISFTLLSIFPLTAQMELPGKNNNPMCALYRFQIWKQVNYKQENWVVGDKGGRKNLIMFYFFYCGSKQIGFIRNISTSSWHQTLTPGRVPPKARAGMTQLRVSVCAWTSTEESQMSSQKMKQESEFLFTQPKSGIHKHANIHGTKWIGFIREEEGSKLSAPWHWEGIKNLPHLCFKNIYSKRFNCILFCCNAWKKPQKCPWRNPNDH